MKFKNVQTCALGLEHAGGQPRLIEAGAEFDADPSEVPQGLLTASLVVAVEAVELDAPGLTSPEQSVELYKALVSAPGVFDVTVSVGADVAVRFNPAVTNADELRAVLQAHDCLHDAE